MIYFVVIAMLIVLSYVYDYRRKEKMRMFWYLFMFVLMVCIGGLRYRLGVDSIMYEMHYEDAPKLWEMFGKKVLESRYGPMFLFFQAFPRSISDDFTLMQFWTTFWICAAVFWFFHKNSRNIFFCLLLFSFFCYFLFIMEQIRQSLAMAMFLLAWKPYRENKWIVYYLLMAVAVMFHLSAAVLLFIPLAKVPGIRQGFVFGRRTIIILAVVFVGGVLVSMYFFKYIQLLNMLTGVTERADAYKHSLFGTQMLNPMGMVRRFITLMAYPLFALYLIKRRMAGYNKEQKKEATCLTAIVLIYCYFCVMSFSMELILRVLNYFYLFAFVAMGDVVYEKFKLGRYLVKVRFAGWALLLLPLFFLQGQSYFIGSDSNNFKLYMNYYPYYSRLDPKMDPMRESYFRYINNKF